MSGPGATTPPGGMPPPPDSPYAPPSAPLAGSPSSGPGGAGNPWERRAELGFVEGLFGNLKLFILSPQEAFEQTRERGDYGSPVLWYLLIGWIGSAASQLWSLLLLPLYSSMIEDIPNLPQGLDAWLVPSVAGTLFGILVMAPIALIIALFLSSGILHLVAMVIGVDRDSSTGFEGTFRAVSYSAVASVAYVIPIAGGFIAALWSLVLTVLGIMRMHRTSEWKAIAVVLLPMVLCCACVALGVVAMIGAIGAAQQ